ncbi:MAG: DUF1036 domain-containing protein [Pseudomonadota bacterium]
MLLVRKNLISFIIGAGLIFGLVQQVEARLEVCNQTDLVLMVAVGYDTTEGRTASEGWWRIYPGFCEVPVDVAMLEGSYYLHAESNPRSTMPVDAFNWGEEKPLCVKLADFRIPDGNFCQDGNIVVKFNQVEKNWRNYNKVDIYFGRRTYEVPYRTRVAGVQRMLSMLGYDIGEIDGVLGKKTVEALDEIGQANQVFGFDFKRIFPLLEQLIAQKQKLDN